MYIKRYCPSWGFVILSTTIVIASLFVQWALGPLKHEQAATAEALAHQLAGEKKSSLALQQFLLAAELGSDSVSISRRYRCAGSMSTVAEDKIKYFTLALRYNANNLNAKNALKSLVQEISYINRTTDAWSAGSQAEIIVNALENGDYELRFFTSNSKKNSYLVQLSVDGIPYKQQEIKPGISYFEILHLALGKHRIGLVIDDTFQPKKLGMGADERELGLNFSLRRVEGND